MGGNAMKRTRRRPGRTDDDKIRYIRIAAVPLIVVAVLVLVIVLMDRKSSENEGRTQTAVEAAADADGKGSEKTGGRTEDSPGGEDLDGESRDGESQGADTDEDADSSEGEESIAPDNNEYTTDFSDYELKKDQIPQVNQLISRYFQAKVDQDPEALFELFGKTDDDELETRRGQLKDEAVYIEDYQDITCYTKPGLTEDSYVVYVTYDVKFRRVDTLAPGLMWCYVAKADDGSYIIRENVVGDEADYVAEQNQTEDVRLLSAQVNERLKAAIESDSLLAGIYKDLRNGAVAGDSPEEGSDSEVQLIEETTVGEDSQNGGEDSQNVRGEGPNAGGEGQNVSEEAQDAAEAHTENDGSQTASGETDTAASGGVSSVEIMD